jgi:N-acetylglucosamine-6-phosphate deacetylase
LGLHVEGPFLNPLKKGAHNPKYLLPPDLSLIRDWSPARCVRLVTLAPELPGALELVRELVSRGVVVSVGHTMAQSDDAHAAFASGARYATHLFNAMRPLHHQDPGVVGAVLANPMWMAGIIPDGVHVHPEVVRAVWLAKRHQLNLVSDAMGALGMPAGSYVLNDFDVLVGDRDARLEDGTLAGSVLSLDQGVRNLIAYTGCPLQEALQTVTTAPARLLGIERERGALIPGLAGDLVLLDAQLMVKTTIAGGEIVFP